MKPEAIREGARLGRKGDGHGVLEELLDADTDMLSVRLRRSSRLCSWTCRGDSECCVSVWTNRNGLDEHVERPEERIRGPGVIED